MFFPIVKGMMYCPLEETANNSNINYQLRDFDDAFLSAGLVPGYMHRLFQWKMRLNRKPFQFRVHTKTNLKGSRSKHSLSIVDGHNSWKALILQLLLRRRGGPSAFWPMWIPLMWSGLCILAWPRVPDYYVVTIRMLSPNTLRLWWLQGLVFLNYSLGLSSSEDAHPKDLTLLDFTWFGHRSSNQNQDCFNTDIFCPVSFCRVTLKGTTCPSKPWRWKKSHKGIIIQRPHAKSGLNLMNPSWNPTQKHMQIATYRKDLLTFVEVLHA